MILNWLGLSVKTGSIRDEESEITITSEKKLFYYSKSDSKIQKQKDLKNIHTELNKIKKEQTCQ